MYWGLGIGVIILVMIGGALLVLAFWLPDTRSGTYDVYLKGTVGQVWAVYTDPGSQAAWRDDIQEVIGLSGEKGAREWTEVSSSGLRITFRETVFTPPTRYGLEFSAKGRFNGSFSAEFQQIEANQVQATVSESVTSLGLGPKLLSLIFVRPQQMIERFADAAQREIDRREIDRREINRRAASP